MNSRKVAPLGVRLKVELGRLSIALVVGVALLMPAAVSAAGPGAAARSATDSARARSGTVQGVQRTVRPTKRPTKLTSAQLRAINAADSQQPPKVKAYAGPMPKAAGRALRAPSSNRVKVPRVGRNGVASVASQADPLSFRFMESRVLPFAGLRAGVSEPSGDGAGRMRFVTSNWTAQRSTDGGATWTYINPFANFGGGTDFCCDQVSLYDASHDRFFWVRQYANHLELSNSQNLVNWCTYVIPPTLFGLPSTADFDYNHMGLSAGNVYVGTYVRNGASSLGELVFRWNIDQMADCATAGFSWFGPRTTEFAESFVNGAGDQMYWGTNWATGGLTPGSGMRIFRWADDSNTIFWYDRAITPFAFMSFGGTQNCGSANGLVLNWCQRTDSRMSGNGYIAFPSLAQTPYGGVGPDTDAVIGFAFNANRDASHPRPYVRRVYFRVRDMAYLGRSEFWNSQVAVLYPDMASNARGHVGMIFAWGGGDGTNGWYPGYGFVIDDDISQLQPWAYSWGYYGAGNACLNTADNRRRWGDYLTIKAYSPARLVWIAEGFRMNAATNCVTGANVPQVEYRQVIFGRNRDTWSWLRWYNR